MVVQRRTRGFLGKVNEFFGDKTTPERQRSGVVHFMFRRRSAVVHAAVQIGSTGTILRYLCRTFRPAGWSKKIVRPGASCEFLEILHKNYFRGLDRPAGLSLSRL
jgi:hypothetical protein